MGIAKILPKRHDLNMPDLAFCIGASAGVEGERGRMVLWLRARGLSGSTALLRVIRRRHLKIFVCLRPLLTSNVGHRPAYNIVEARSTGQGEKGPSGP